MIAGNLPRGLLSLLGAQNFGQNPAQVQEVVSPIIDLTQLYAANLSVIEAQTNAAVNGGFSSCVTVPTGEMWLVQAMSAFLVTGGAATVARMSPCMRSDNSLVPLSDPIAIAINSTAWNVAEGLPLLLKSGTELGLYTDAVVGGPLTGSVSYLVAKLRA